MLGAFLAIILPMPVVVNGVVVADAAVVQLHWLISLDLHGCCQASSETSRGNGNGGKWSSDFIEDFQRLLYWCSVVNPNNRLLAIE